MARYTTRFLHADIFFRAIAQARVDNSVNLTFRSFLSPDLLIIDDLGYLPQGAEESEVLFTLIAERYERRSLEITSNLVFSQWEKVFANPMATAAAIDWIVHHSATLEFDMPNYRTGVAKHRQEKEFSDRQNNCRIRKNS